MRKLLKKFIINGSEYVFNGVNYDLYKVTDEKEYEKYRMEEDEPVSLNYEKSRMSKIVFNFTNNCNLKCRYCYADGSVYASQRAECMSRDTFNKLISQIENDGVKGIGVVSFFGGEPLINYELIKYALPVLSEKFDIGVFEIVTNSWYVTQDKLDLLDKYNVRLVLSCDGPEDITDYLRGKGTYNKIMEAYKLACSIGYKELSMSATYTRKHEEFGYSYYDIENFFKNMKIQATISSVLSSDAEMLPHMNYTIEQHERQMEQNIEKIIHNEKEGAVNPYLYRTLLSLTCGAHSYNFCDDLNKKWQVSYDYDGTPYNCFHFWGDENYKLAHDEAAVKSIEVANNKDNFEECRNCWSKYLCKICTAAVMQGTFSMGFKSGTCTDRELYECAMYSILKCKEDGTLKQLLDNFYESFVEYKF